MANEVVTPEEHDRIAYERAIAEVRDARRDHSRACKALADAERALHDAERKYMKFWMDNGDRLARSTGR